MKIKGILSIILALCMLLSVQSISVLAGNTDATEEAENFVTLFAGFNNFEGEDMLTEDNKNFFFVTALEAGSYQFTIDVNGTSFSNPTTVKDTTARTSPEGLPLFDYVDANCTLLASGGEYTFEYNTDAKTLNIKKAGTANPSGSGNSLKIKANGEEITANKGDKFTYNVYLKAADAFEDIQAVINFDESKLSLTGTTAEICCPALIDTSFNTDINGLIAVNSSNLAGYDFKEEKLLLTLEFTATGTGEAYLDFIAQDMTVFGGEKSYYFLSKEENTGATFREAFVIDVPEIPTTGATDATDATDATNATGTTDSTEPSEIIPTTPDITNPTETTPSATNPQESTALTSSTEPSETSATNPTTATAPATGFELGDVNRDSKLNIRDATLIQKVLAKLEQFDNEQLILADYLTDGKVNIKDATQIQKKLANLI